MKIVVWVDSEGYKHRSMLRDSDSPLRPEIGIPSDPPDIRSIDWDVVTRDLHNLLVERGLLTSKDISEKPGQLSNAVNITATRAIIRLFRQETT